MKRLPGALVLVLAASTVYAAEITFQAWNYHMPGEREFYDGLIADFEASHPGDSVRFQFGEWEGAHEKIAQWLESQTGPDLVVAPDMWIAEFADDLVPYVDDLPAELKAEFFEVLLNKATYRGHTYGLVWATSTKALFYRTDLFEKAGLAGPPRDWDELLECARRLHHWDSPYGLGIPVKPTYESTDNWYFFFWSAGGEFFNEDGRAAVNSPIGVASLKFYRDLARRHHVTQPEPTSWSRKETRQYFIQGKVAMHANGPWVVADIHSKNPDLQYAVAPLPVAPDRPPFEPRRTTQVITDHLMMPAHCRQPELALEFIEFAYQDRYRQQFCELGMVPEKRSVAESGFFQNDPDWKIFVDIIPDGKFIPLMRWEPIELAAQQMLYKVFTGRQDVRSALDELAAVMDAEVAAQGAED
ncbi:MAG: ABC transporter substrate-binding protein [Armatimonadota bacterium]